MGRQADLLDTPPSLKPELEQIGELPLCIERFQSLVDDRKLLSLSFWRDEEGGVKAWRNVEHHRQGGGRRYAAACCATIACASLLVMRD